MEFREFYKLYEKIQTRSNPRNDTWAPLGMVIPNTNAFGAIPAQVSGSQWGDMPLSSGGYMGTNWVNGQFDLALPSVTRTAKISFIDKKTTPVLVYLDDNTKLEIPPILLRKLNIEPEVGRTIMVTFQRRQDDGSINYSKIHSLKCF